MSLGQRLQPLTSFAWRGEREVLAAPGTAVDTEGLVCLPRLRYGAGWIAAAGLAIGGLVLAVRQGVGGLAPPPPLILLAACAVCVGVVRLVDAVVGGAAGVVARGGLLLAIGALALPPRPGTPIEWLARILVIVAAAAVLLTPPRRTRPPRQKVVGAARDRVDRPRRRAPRGLLQQRLERFSAPDGGECLRGTLMIEVPAGGRTGWGHVAFCPTFPELPQVRASTRYDEADVTVSAAEILPWGARIECRLDEPAEHPVRVPVTLTVRGPRPSGEGSPVGPA